MKYPNELIVNDYVAGLSLNDLVAKYDCCLATAWRITKDAGINRPRQKGICDHGFFDIIDTEAKAYWLGFITADGNVYCKDGKHTITLRLSIRDIALLEQFRTDLQISNKVRVFKQTNGFKPVEVCSIQMSSPQIVNALSLFGVVPAKTGKTFAASVDFGLQHHYWRGVVDGDGYVSTSKFRPNKDGKVRKEQFIIGLVGDYQLVDSFRLFSNNLTGTTASIRPHSSIYDFTIRGQSGLQIAKLLYFDATIFLKRKRDKLIQYLEKYDV